MARAKQTELESVVALEDTLTEVSSLDNTQDDGVVSIKKMKEQKASLEKEVSDLDEKIIELQKARAKRIQEIDYLIVSIERSDSKPYNAVMDFLSSVSKRAGG